jgi:hypothetical protein
MKKFSLLFSIIFSTFILTACGGSSNGGTSSSTGTPNILFVIMDDVGIDQMESFGYGGDTPPSMPNILTIARSGVRFRNTWSMPECSPGRASMFVGRFPFRTKINGAIGQDDLANSQVSPYDMTTPKLLKQANYDSGLFGKFHLAGPDNNQAGNGTPGQLGWDYFYGWIGGLPASIDTTAGGIAATGTYSCGFVPGTGSGACRQANGSCSVINGPNAVGDSAGKRCLMSGGIFVPNTSCQDAPPSGLNFSTTQNAYYVSPLVINQGDVVTTVPLTDPRNRGYRSTIEADAAISWIKSRPSTKPWMATVSFSSAHTPLQQAPIGLAPVSGAAADLLDCKNSTQQRDIQNQMTEAMDTEFGRLMVEIGLATRGPTGRLIYDPKASNTMVVIVGDNGTLGGSVKSPFNPNLAKGTAYQTGVWVPLIAAGPLVVQPDREVNHMVNMVDVFQLFGEIAGINVPASVPRVIDAAPLLPYLTKTDQSSIRTVNFAQGSYNIQANGGRNGPCVFSGTTCSQIPISKSVCEDNNGVWWGLGFDTAGATAVPQTAGHSSSQGYQNCCQVNQAQSSLSLTLSAIVAETSTGIRNDGYKIVQNTTQYFDVANNTCVDSSGNQLVTVTNEFYQIDQAAPIPKLDDPGSANQLNPNSSSTLLSIYNSLMSQLNSILASQPACPGDANIDGQVNSEDLSVWQKFLNWAGTAVGVLSSSVADFNWDGLTNNIDAQTIRNNQGGCPTATSVY